MATKKIKINFKMPTPTAAERLHAQQQKNRKAAGLPDPSEYKKKLDSMKSENYEEDDGSLSQEQLDEISAQLKASYVSGAKKQIKQSLPFTKKTDEYRDIAKNFIAKRQKGIAKANEEVELDEDEDKVNARKMYHKHFVAAMKVMPSSAKQRHHQAEMAKYKAMMGDSFVNQVAPKKFAKFDKKANEEVELLDEMPESSMKTRDVHSHLKKAGWELARSKGGHDVYKHPKAKHSIPVPRHNQLKAPLIRGIMKASKVEEGVTLGRLVGRGNIYQYDRNPGPRDGSELENVPFHAKTEKQKKLQNALNDLGKKMKETHPKLKEDSSDDIIVYKKGSNVRQKIKANSYDTFKSHGFRKEAADEREYDYEGDMAKSDLRSIIYNAKELHDMLDDNTNLAEWCQSKITLAEDYISTVTNYMRSEMNEEVELDEMIVIKTNKPIGTRVADIGPGGKEYNVKTDKAYDDAKKKQPQGADFAAQRRKERLAKSGRMDEEQHSVLYKMKKDDKKIAVAHYKLKDDAHKFLSSVKTKGGNGIVRSKTNEEIELDEKENLPGLWANIHAKRKRGEPPAKPGDKDYPKNLETVRSADKESVKESAAEPTEGEMKGKQQMSRKAQIVMNAAGKGKKSDSPEKFQKDPELSSEIHKT
jgi:predicted RNA binding protein YcfA (HicA-like mRNA interferase family)